MHTLKTIAKDHGLTLRFARKCLDAMPDLFEPHISRGKDNSIILDSSGFTLFDQIKQHKENGLTLPEIEHRLRKAMETTLSNGGKPEGKPKSESEPAEDPRGAELLEATRKIAELQEALGNLKANNERLRSGVMLLTDGRGEDGIEAAREKRVKARLERVRLVAELKNLGVFAFRKRAKIAARLEELENEAF